MTRLHEVLARLDDFEDSQTIFATAPWTSNSETVVVNENDLAENAARPSGYSYLLEVALAKDALEVWRSWRADREPSTDERCEAVIHYALNDAYLPVRKGPI